MSLLLSLILSSMAWAHVPVLLLPIKGTPITTYYVGNSSVSRAIYSELTNSGDFFVVNFLVTAGNEKSLIQMLTPVCSAIPRYESFQPSAMVFEGEAPWKNQGESNTDYINRLKAKAIARIESNFPVGSRPKYYEEFAKQYYWVGGEWRGNLKPGIYSIAVYDSKGDRGTFTLGLNEKEAWTPDLWKYVAEVLPSISAGICNPKGFSGAMPE
ncbi:hypothetical protein [Bdellovibrio sp. HCB337]|uniref:hypothetical protein n=1 Tax=Bdellovibrio sp. HCB337 TaxID=3394358 RepID=UPI0039A732D0